MEQPTHLYRYERGSIDRMNFNIPGHTAFYGQAKVYLETYKISRFTPSGYWVSIGGGEKFVLKVNTINALACGKRFAYLDVDNAWDNFQRRTKLCRDILKARLRDAEAYLLAERPKTDEYNFKS